jgi:hypothetical protein
MKKLFSTLLCFLSLIQLVKSQEAYYMEYTMEAGKTAEGFKVLNKTWSSKFGTRIESNMNIPGMGPKKTIMITPSANPDVFYTIDEIKKSYTETVKPKEDTDEKDITIEVVGQEKIGNYNCTHGKVKSKDMVLDIWTTKDIEGYKEMQHAALMQNKGKSFEKAFKSKELEGMMVRMKNTNSKEAFTMDLVKFEKGNFPQSMFEIPAGYTKGASFDPSKMKDMSPEERQKMMEELMKQYGKDEKE